ncbi:RrF2 family transcriptional regulator [Gorillibacterium sp. sgz500922]|uniref:RrF2 family transcriptional regulator n=1 Tax=Gorillibacterium sp. sgz500922 TaxID=3446694 RepID=UPI003F6680E0
MNSEFTIAVHSLVFLTYQSGGMATSDEIAHNVNTHPSRVRKVMSCLRKSGYVATKEGLGGGYLLSRSPGEVTLAELYGATSVGSIKPGWCSGSEEAECMVACHMAEVMDHIFGEAEREMLIYLEKLTIRDVLDRIRSAEAQKRKPM